MKTSNALINSALLAWGLLAASARPADAGLLGTEVFGSLDFPSPEPEMNYFEPSLGFVPPGCLNAAGTTVAITDSAVEFGFITTGFGGYFYQLTVDFTDTQLVITATTHNPSVPEDSGREFLLFFRNPAFSILDEVSNGFGTALTADFEAGPGGIIGFRLYGPDSVPLGNQGLSAVYNLVVPEPPSSSLLAVGGLTALAYSCRRRKRAPEMTRKPHDGRNSDITPIIGRCIREDPVSTPATQGPFTEDAPADPTESRRVRVALIVQGPMSRSRA